MADPGDDEERKGGQVGGGKGITDHGEEHNPIGPKMPSFSLP
jgi:hypothetical protein